MPYTPPIRDIRFVLDSIVGFAALEATGAFPDLSSDLVDAVLEGAGKLAAEEIAPLNATGDRDGARLTPDGVVAAPGFAEAYRQFVEGGWGGVPFDPAYGGQGLPRTLMLAVQEFLQGANMAFGLCPLLTQGAIESLTAHGTDEQRRLFLPKLISGEWSGTMNLTEPQAGSDVGALKARAEPVGDGTYRIFGTKIFITWGDHDMAENIVHLVLARLPGAPGGTKGISLFLVPKVLVNPDGTLGARNDVACLKLEEKLGIHASPTCVMAYGEKGGAVGTLIGEENRGMACMFTMMNNARLNVGLQGVGVAEHAYQLALAYARERRQGKAHGRPADGSGQSAIVEHADVRRMLMTMKSSIEAMRAICYATAMGHDLAHALPDKAARVRARARQEVLTPIAKAWSTDLGVELSSMAVQVFGGMGFVEETGIAQMLRDARICPIYEGTNGIQAIDLATRKLGLEGGEAVRALIVEAASTAASLLETEDPGLRAAGHALSEGTQAATRATSWLLERAAQAPDDVLAGATPYLKLMGAVTGAHFLGQGALAARARLKAGNGDASFLKARIATATFFATQLLPPALRLADAITAGADILFALSEDDLAA
ncbi:MAG: acyl-CoA dehydrogenase C-terminal domain-containing protein [Alphaproteobacteria bacterium]|nr:acyl-CoA dehydrogenase C-terminal domain-containing protein [Alphaproteobacteria bacterium]